MTFMARTKLTFREIYQGFKIKVLYRFVLFYFVFCGIVPSFTNYFYYYLTDDLDFSQLEYATLNIVSSLLLLLGIYCYNKWFIETESTYMLAACCFINAFGGLNSMLLIRGFSYGMNPKAFAFMSGSVTDSLSSSIRLLSGNVLFAKLIPANIEASMFAILTGLINFCNFFLAKQLGNFINIFVGVTNDDLSDLWILFAIMSGCALIPLLFVWLIPKRKEVFLV